MRPRSCLLLVFLLLGCRMAAETSPTWAIRLQVECHKRWFPKPGVLELTTPEGHSLARFEFTWESVHLALAGEEVTAKLGTFPVTREFLIRQSPTSGVFVYLNGGHLFQTQAPLPGPVKATFTDSNAARALAPPRVQKTGPIVFADDFSRTTRDASQWEVLGGEFQVSSTWAPENTQSAFHFHGHANGKDGIALADGSHWFWNDYRVGVALRPQTAGGGLVFNYRSPMTWHALRWQPDGMLQLVRCVEGTEVVCRKTYLPLVPGQWYRFTVVSIGIDIRAYINGAALLQMKDPAAGGGKVGLLVTGAGGVDFDDFITRSATQSDRLADPFGPAENQWAEFSGKHFYDDRWMMQWSHPRSFWQANGNWQWFRTRLFHDAAWVWRRGRRQPPLPWEVTLFGDPETPDSGYRLRFADAQLTLSRGGQAVATTPLTATDLRHVVCAADDGRVTVSVNDQEILAWTDPEPLTDGRVGADLGRTVGINLRSPDWRDDVQVRSTHRLDYGFAGAPTAWYAQSGVWRGTHRWACVPKWSFFSARGEPGGPGVEHAGVSLWNRRRFAGDFDLELFLAPLEGTTQQMHFESPVAMNVAFAADGEHLDSGYLFHFGTYDEPSRLFRAGREVGVCADLPIPDLRLNPMRWYHRVTQVWQHVRIRRRGAQVHVDVTPSDDRGQPLAPVRVFDFTDPEPLTGDRFGLFAWGANGLAIARATISYADSPGVGAPEATPPAPLDRVVNHESGGPFLYELTDEPLEVAEKGQLTFACRLPQGLALSVLASVRGQTAEWILTGPEIPRPSVIPMGRLKVQDTENWQTLQVNLGELASVFGFGDLVVDRLVIGSPCATLAQRAGLGVNRAGAWYAVRDVQFQAIHWPGGGPPTHVPRLVQDFETDCGDVRQMGGSDGAVLYRDPVDPAAGKYSLRLLNTRVGGNAGAWLTRTPYDLATLPEIAFAYRFPRGMALNLLIEANDRQFEVLGSQSDASWPVIGRLPDMVADGTWRQTRFNLYEALKPRLRTDKIQVTAIALTDSNYHACPQDQAVWIDDLRLIPADPAAPSPFPEQAMPQLPVVSAGESLYVSYIPSDRLMRETFEWSARPGDPVGVYGDTAIRRSAWLLAGHDDAATGRGCLIAQNLDAREFYSVYLHRHEWDVNRYPVLSFDYRFEEPRCTLNLTFMADETLAAVRWTHRSQGAYFQPMDIGAAPQAIQDGKWHHCTVDLGTMLGRDNDEPLLASELAIWATSMHAGYDNPPHARIRFDNITLHSNRGRNPAFEWQAIPGAAYSYVFDQQPDTIPPETVMTNDCTVSFPDTAPGKWTFHLRARTPDGRWTDPVHITVVIE